MLRDSDHGQPQEEKGCCGKQDVSNGRDCCARGAEGSNEVDCPQKASCGQQQAIGKKSGWCANKDQKVKGLRCEQPKDEKKKKGCCEEEEEEEEVEEEEEEEEEQGKDKACCGKQEVSDDNSRFERKNMGCGQRGIEGKESSCCAKKEQACSGKKRARPDQRKGCNDWADETTPLISSQSAPKAETGAQTVTFAVGGVTCSDCSLMIEARLKQKRGILAIQVSPVTGQAVVTYNTAMLDEKAITKEIELMGFSAELMASSSPSRADFHIAGLVLTQDVRNIERHLTSLPGVVSVSVDLKTQIISIEYQPLTTGARTLMDEIEGLGFSPKLRASASRALTLSQTRQEITRLRRCFWVSAFFGLPVLLIAFVAPYVPYVSKAFEERIISNITFAVLTNWLLATPIQFYVGYPLYLSAYRALIYGRTANMDTLVILSTTTAYMYSLVSVIITLVKSSYETEFFFETSAILLMLIMLGRYMEALAKGKASDLVTKLLEMQPMTAILLQEATGGVERVIDINLVQPGDLLRVLPGGKIPTDGIIAFGSTSVDESMITGEAMPVAKVLGDTVYGGTINQYGGVHVRATKTASESTLASIASLVEQAQLTKPAVQRVADLIAALFVPSVLLLTLLVFSGWLVLAMTKIVDVSGHAVPFALRFALAVLIISCPCAIGLAVPTAIMAGTSIAAKHGILFKSGAALETCHQASGIVFDKTGTLTQGHPSVTNLHILAGDSDAAFSRHQVLHLIASAERMSEHVLGRVIFEYCQTEIGGEGHLFEEASNFVAAPGKGLSCTISGLVIAIGNRLWIKEHGVFIPLATEETAIQLEEQGQTVVWTAVDGQLIALIALADQLKAEARAVLSELQQMGLDVWMLSGDNQRTVDAIAQRLAITQAAGGLLPEDKAAKIRELQEQKQIVCMVGDGVNDSPALTQANVGIAVGAGSDIAMEAADVVLMRSNLQDVLVALHISRTTFRCIKLNFSWAFFYNALGIPIAAGILYPFTNFVLPPALAGLSELLSSLPVVLFSLLMRLTYQVPKGIQAVSFTEEV